MTRGVTGNLPSKRRGEMEWQSSRRHYHNNTFHELGLLIMWESTTLTINLSPTINTPNKSAHNEEETKPIQNSFSKEGEAIIIFTQKKKSSSQSKFELLSSQLRVHTSDHWPIGIFCNWYTQFIFTGCCLFKIKRHIIRGCGWQVMQKAIQRLKGSGVGCSKSEVE